MMKKILSLLMVISIVLSLGSSMVVFGYRSRNLYSDVSSSHWAYDAISFATEQKWFNGYSDGSFCPDNTISRSEAVKVLVSLLGREVNEVTTSSYRDVSVKEWYAPYIEAGKDLFLNVEDGGRFKPENPISREETIYALVRGMQLNISVEYVDLSMLEKFTDHDEIDQTIKPYFTIAMQKKLISGYSDGTVKAKDSLTRAEFATLLYRAYWISQGRDIDQSEMAIDDVKSYEASNEDVEATESMEDAMREEIKKKIREQQDNTLKQRLESL